MKDKLAFHDRTVAVRIALADELEALCRSDGVDFIRRTLDSEINVIAGFDGCDEICGIRNLGHAALIGVGLGIRRTAGCTLEVEDDVILAGSGEPAYRGGGGLFVFCAEVISDYIAAAGGSEFDVAHVPVVLIILGPGEGNAVFRASCNFKEEVVLDGVGPEGAVEPCPAGAVTTLGHAADLETVPAVGFECGLERNLFGLQHDIHHGR